MSEAQQRGSRQTVAGWGRHFIRKALAEPLPRGARPGAPRGGVGAALPGAYKYVSSGHWSRPSDSQACGVLGGHQNQLDSGRGWEGLVGDSQAP